MPRCTECSSQFTSIEYLYFHYKEVHDFSTLKLFRCKESNCYRDFSSWNSFRKHLISHHDCKSSSHKCIKNSAIKVLEKEVDDTSNDIFIVSSQNEVVLKHESKTSTHEFGIPCSSKESSETKNLNSESSNQSMKVNQFLAQFEKKIDDIISQQTLEVYADPHMSQVEVQRMIDRTKHLVNTVVENFKFMIKLLEEDTPIDTHVKTTLDKFLLAVSRKLTEHDSHHKRFVKMTRDGFIKPIPVIVGSSVEEKLINNEIVKELCPLKAFRMSLKDIFKQFLGRPGVLKRILKYMSDLYSNHTVLSNLIQGQNWRQKILIHYKDKLVIPFLIYIDDFEINNPLGSHRGIQKLCGVYCSLLGLPPEFRSKLENILLVMLFHSSDRKNVGYSRILSSLIDEINELSRTGIDFVVDGKIITVYFALAVVIGDNLGLNSVFGLVESFRAHFFCRLCLVFNKDTETDSKERKDKLRRIENYEKDLEEGPKKSGLKEYSMFNDVDNYHIYENDYFDILHDIKEGALNFGLGEILYFFVIKDESLDIDIFNDRLKTFNYTANGFSNKPPPILLDDVKNKKFSLSASETMTLFLILPYLIGDIIDLKCDVWQFYLVLREILDLIIARNIQIECTYLIDALVEEHHEMYVRLFERPLRPKQHNMIHYGSCIRRRGPFSGLDTVRFEANHKFFKTAASSTSSRKEITYTLCLKDQYNFYYQMKYGDGLVSKLDLGPKSALPKNVLANYPFMDEQTCQCNWVQVKGIKYSIGTCIVVRLDERETPIFGIVDRIFVGQNELISVKYKLLDTEYYDVLMHAFSVQWTGKTGMIQNILNLFSPFPAIIHRMPENLYVSLKQAI